MAPPRSTCPECGQPIRPEWVTCAVCGRRLVDYRRPRRTFRPEHSAAYLPPPPPAGFSGDEEEEAPRPAPRAKPRPRRRGDRGWVWWGLFPALIIIAIVIIALWGIDLLPARGPPSSDLIPSGQKYTVPPLSLSYVEFTLGQTEQVVGSFNATAGVWTYIVNQSQLDVVTGGGIPAGYAWTAGNVTNESFSLKLDEDVWFLLWENYNQGAVTVAFTSALTATP